MKLALVPEAFVELDAAIAYYEDQRPGLGVEFYLQIEAVVELAAERPELGHLIADPQLLLRKFVVKRFPFIVWVAGSPEGQRVVAIAHASREPGYWRERAK